MKLTRRDHLKYCAGFLTLPWMGLGTKTIYSPRLEEKQRKYNLTLCSIGTIPCNNDCGIHLSYAYNIIVNKQQEQKIKDYIAGGLRHPASTAYGMFHGMNIYHIVSNYYYGGLIHQVDIIYPLFEYHRKLNNINVIDNCKKLIELRQVVAFDGSIFNGKEFI